MNDQSQESGKGPSEEKLEDIIFRIAQTVEEQGKEIKKLREAIEGLEKDLSDRNH